MRIIVAVVGLVWLGLPVSLHAGDREKALAVIEQAIKAHGGADALSKAQMRSRTGKGVILGPSGEVPITTEEIVHFPDRCRVFLEFGPNRLIVVLKGDKGWIQSGGATRELGKEALLVRREDLYVWWLMNLTPLVKEEFDLTPLADDKVNRQEAAVVKVSRKGYPDVRLFFDKKSGLLVKIARPITESGVTLTQEVYFSEHKDYDGVKMPTKEVVTHNRNKFAEVTFSSYKILPRIDDKTFEKP